MQPDIFPIVFHCCHWHPWQICRWCHWYQWQICRRCHVNFMHASVLAEGGHFNLPAFGDMHGGPITPIGEPPFPDGDPCHKFFLGLLCWGAWYWSIPLQTNARLSGPTAIPCSTSCSLSPAGWTILSSVKRALVIFLWCCINFPLPICYLGDCCSTYMSGRGVCSIPFPHTMVICSTKVLWLNHELLAMTVLPTRMFLACMMIPRGPLWSSSISSSHHLVVWFGSTWRFLPPGLLPQTCWKWRDSFSEQ